MSIIPDKLLRLFRAELTSLIQAGGGRSHNSSKEDISAQSQRNMSLCLTFLKFFVNTIGTYRKYLVRSEECIHEGDQFEFNASFLLEFWGGCLSVC